MIASISTFTQPGSEPNRRPSAARVATRALIALALLIPMLWTSSTFAQGTSNAFADPMDYKRVHALLKPLALSEQQITAVDHEHATYLEACRQLRDTRIKAYLDEFGSIPMHFQQDAAVVEKAADDQLAIHRDQKRIDENFFAAIAPLLNDEQAEYLPVIAARRERQRTGRRMSAMDWSLPRVGQFDVSTIVARMKLSPEETQTVDALMRPYEASITQAFQRIEALNRKLTVEKQRRIQEHRASVDERVQNLAEEFDTETPEGREAMAAAMEDMFSGDTDMFDFVGGDDGIPEAKDLRDEIVRVSRLSRSVVQQMIPALTEDNARSLERQFHRNAFGNLRIPRDVLRTRVLRKEKLDDIEQDLLTAITELYDRYLESRSSMVNAVAKAAEDDQFKSSNGYVFYGPDSANKDDKKDKTPIESARDNIKDLNERTLKEWAALTGEEVPNSVTGSRIVALDGGGSVLLEPGGEASVAIMSFASESGGGEMVQEVFISAAPIEGALIGENVAGGVFEVVMDGAEDMDGELPMMNWSAPAPSRRRATLPDAIEPDIVDNLTDRLALDDMQREILDSIYTDYSETFEALEQDLINPIRENVKAASRWRSDANVASGDVANAFDDMPDAMKRIEVSDIEFFETVGLIFEGDDRKETLEHEKLKRACDAFNNSARNSGGMMFGAPGANSQEGDINLASLFDSLDIDAKQRAAAASILRDYLTTTRPLFEDSWEARLNAQREQIIQRLEMRQKAKESAGDDGSTRMISMSFDADAMKRSRELGNVVADIATSITNENQKTLSALGSAVSESTLADIIDAYHRKAFPNIYQDHLALDRAFQTAMASPDLDPSKRDQLDDLWIEYRHAYDDICQRMIDRSRAFQREADEKRSSQNETNAMDPEQFKRFESFNQDNEADRFERKNLNQRIGSRIQSLLGEGFFKDKGVRIIK